MPGNQNLQQRSHSSRHSPLVGFALVLLVTVLVVAGRFAPILFPMILGFFGRGRSPSSALSGDQNSFALASPNEGSEVSTRVRPDQVPFLGPRFSRQLSSVSSRASLEPSRPVLMSEPEDGWSPISSINLAGEVQALVRKKDILFVLTARADKEIYLVSVNINGKTLTAEEGVLLSDAVYTVKNSLQMKFSEDERLLFVPLTENVNYSILVFNVEEPKNPKLLYKVSCAVSWDYSIMGDKFITLLTNNISAGLDNLSNGALLNTISWRYPAEGTSYYPMLPSALFSNSQQGYVLDSHWEVSTSEPSKVVYLLPFQLGSTGPVLSRINRIPLPKHRSDWIPQDAQDILTDDTIIYTLVSGFVEKKRVTCLTTFMRSNNSPIYNIAIESFHPKRIFVNGPYLMLANADGGMLLVAKTGKVLANYQSFNNLQSRSDKGVPLLMDQDSLIYGSVVVPRNGLLVQTTTNLQFLQQSPLRFVASSIDYPRQGSGILVTPDQIGAKLGSYYPSEFLYSVLAADCSFELYTRIVGNFTGDDILNRRLIFRVNGSSPTLSLIVSAPYLAAQQQRITITFSGEAKPSSDVVAWLGAAIGMLLLGCVAAYGCIKSRREVELRALRVQHGNNNAPHQPAIQLDLSIHINIESAGAILTIQQLYDRFRSLRSQPEGQSEISEIIELGNGEFKGESQAYDPGEEDDPLEGIPSALAPINLLPFEKPFLASCGHTFDEAEIFGMFIEENRKRDLARGQQLEQKDQKQPDDPKAPEIKCSLCRSLVSCFVRDITLAKIVAELQEKKNIAGNPEAKRAISNSAQPLQDADSPMPALQCAEILLQAVPEQKSGELDPNASVVASLPLVLPSPISQSSAALVIPLAPPNAEDEHLGPPQIEGTARRLSV